jgi:hypothetical protein
MHERDRPSGRADHPHPQEWAAVERGLPGRDCQKPSPACHTTLWPSLLEALDRRPRPKPDRGEPSHGLRANHCRAMDAVPQILRRVHRRSRPDPQTAEIQIRIALMTASTPSAPPRSSAWPETKGERGSHTSSQLFATTPLQWLKHRRGFIDQIAEVFENPEDHKARQSRLAEREELDGLKVQR